MATIIKEKGIILGVDPGFDAVKVCVNGELFKIPKEVADVTGKAGLFLGNKEDSYLKISYLPGKEHLVGTYASRFLNEASVEKNTGSMEKENISDTFASFETVDKEILVMAAVGLALIKEAESGDSTLTIKEEADGSKRILQNGSDIIIGAALPHDAVDTEWAYINSWLSQPHEFTLETIDGLYHIEVAPRKTMKASQVVVALVGTISNDEGEIDVSGDLLQNENLPALVIDGGYLTVGKFLFTSVKSVDGGGSNQDYAMKNIYENVAAEIQKTYGREDITSRKIKRIMEKKENIPYIGKDGKSGMIDVQDMVKEELKKVCRTMLDELYKEYNNLLDVKAIIITGGTGAAYYEIIKDILKEERSWIKVILTDYKFCGKKISPEYAIAVGMYKAAKHAYNINTK